MIRFPQIQVVAFDADDTLWENETRFRAAERKAAEVISEYADFATMSSELYRTEVKNMPDYGYGAMAYTLSILETAVRLSEGRLTGDQALRIIETGRELLHNPATPLPGVTETLETLKKSGRYRLAVITKGDLKDQGGKLERSGLLPFFEICEIVADKGEKEYSQIIDRAGVGAGEFLMVGNSFKSDIAPVLRLGGFGIHIPFHTTWELEKTEEFDHPNLLRLDNFSDLPDVLL